MNLRPLFALQLCLVSCAGAPNRHVRGEGSAEIQGPYVAANTRIAVQLSRVLDLSSSTPGAVFEGVVSSDVRTVQGVALVTAGATVSGTLRWGSHTGRIFIDGARVDTPVGLLALRAELEVPPTDGTASVHTLASDRVRSDGPPLARAASPTSAPVTARGLLTQGTVVELVLSRPLLAPGSRVLTF